MFWAGAARSKYCPSPFVMGWIPRTSLLKLQQAQFPGLERSFHTVADVQLGEDVGDVILDRAFRQHQLVGDLAVGGAVGQQAQDLNLARGERFDPVPGRRGSLIGQAGKFGHHARGDRGLQERLPARRGADGLDTVCRWGRL